MLSRIEAYLQPSSQRRWVSAQAPEQPGADAVETALDQRGAGQANAPGDPTAREVAWARGTRLVQLPRGPDKHRGADDVLRGREAPVVAAFAPS